MSKLNKQYAIGIDIGGTKMSAVLFDGETSVADYTLATPTDNLNHFLIMLDALVKPLEDEAKKRKKQIAGIGVGVPGVLNQEKTKILRCRNVSILNNIELIKKLHEKFNFPVVLDNDAKCFLRAEAMLGAGRKFKNIFGIVIGTGIGGGWWFNNKIYPGTYCNGGEPGRMIINFQEPIDLEAAYRKLTQNNPAKLAQEAYRGDVLAERAFSEFGRFLGLALINITNLIDPEAIIIGGGAAESSNLFLKEAQKTLQEYVKSLEGKRVKIIKGKLGAQAGAIGAAMLISHNT